MPCSLHISSISVCYNIGIHKIIGRSRCIVLKKEGENCERLYFIFLIFIHHINRFDYCYYLLYLMVSHSFSVLYIPTRILMSCLVINIILYFISVCSFKNIRQLNVHVLQSVLSHIILLGWILIWQNYTINSTLNLQ